MAAIFHSPHLMEELGTSLERVGAGLGVRGRRALRPWAIARLAGPLSGLVAGLIGFVMQLLLMIVDVLAVRVGAAAAPPSAAAAAWCCDLQ